MYPTLFNGQKTFINKIYFKIIDPERNDIVIFYDKEDKNYLAKRIIGVPGDSVEIKDGDIYINDSIIQDKFSNSKISFLLVNPEGEPLRNWETGEVVKENENKKKITLKEDQYWVIGDNREISWYGIVNIKDILGKV